VKFHRIFGPNRFERGQEFIGACTALLLVRTGRFEFVVRRRARVTGL
jgi:hypothetical protein